MKIELFIKNLQDIIAAVIEETNINNEFRQKIENIINPPGKKATKPRSKRNKGLIDPYVAIKQGRDSLSLKLGELTVEQLKDVISEHGLDATKNSMRWKKKERLIELIIQKSENRISMGEVFLEINP